MIKLFIAFMLGGIMGVFTTALCVVAGDADRCEECMRLTCEMCKTSDVRVVYVEKSAESEDI